MPKRFDSWVLVAIVSLTAIILGIAITSHVNAFQLRRKADRATHSLKVLDAIGAIRTETRKLQAGQRSFVIFGQDSWLQPFRESAAIVLDKLHELKTLTPEDWEQTERSERAEHQAVSGIASMDEINKLRREKGLEAMLTLAQTRGTSSFVDPLLETLAEMDSAERRRLDYLETQSKDAYDRSIFYVWFSAAFGLCGVVILIVFLRRSMNIRAAVAAMLSTQKDALEKLAADLSEAGRRKDEFLATLAHELRNPLSPLRNGLQIIQAGQRDPKSLAPVLGMMERQLGHMVHLIDDLMDIARISSGKITLRKESVTLRDIVESAVEASRQAIESGDHKLDIRLPDEPVNLCADRIRLAQVLTNLLNNAAKYTPSGGHITLTADRADRVVIRVRDTGIGIAKEMLTTVFEIFTQVGTSLERAQGGLGIGLTLVKSLVEMHGGQVEAFSEGPGSGSEFVVRLPFLATNAVAKLEPDASDTGDGKRSHDILVVDDNRDAADSLAELLKIMGHNVKTVYDGEQGLAVSRDFRPALIFLDLGMPGMNGYEVARQLRLTPELQSVVLVALTGWGQEKDKRETSEAGFDHHLIKPPDITDLRKVIGQIPAYAHRRQRAVEGG
jgi:signal transduction histidine kinase/ActR/RegA family two-component response regulator